MKDEYAETESQGPGYELMTLKLRKRIFSSLHSMPNFKSLGASSLDFLFHQIKSDYIEFEILKRPIITIENITLLAALCL